MADVRESLQLGVTTPRSLHIMVEQERHAMRKIRSRCKRLLKKFYLHEDVLEALDLKKVLGGRTLEYAWLDFCTAIRESEALWIEDEMSPCLANDAVAAFTVCRTHRSTRFVERMQMAFAVAGNQFLAKAHAMLTDAEAVNAHPFPPEEYDPAYKEYTAVCGRGPSGECFSRKFHDSSIQALAMLLAALQKWDFRLETCFEYPSENASVSGGGGGHMTLFVCSEFKKRARNRRDPRFNELYLRAVGRKPWRRPRTEGETEKLIQAHFKGVKKRAWGRKRMTESMRKYGQRAALTRQVNRLADLVGLPYSVS
jgi:hypothetical protein